MSDVQSADSSQGVIDVMDSRKSIRVQAVIDMITSPLPCCFDSDIESRLADVMQILLKKINCSLGPDGFFNERNLCLYDVELIRSAIGCLRQDLFPHVNYKYRNILVEYYFDSTVRCDDDDQDRLCIQCSPIVIRNAENRILYSRGSISESELFKYIEGNMYCADCCKPLFCFGGWKIINIKTLLSVCIFFSLRCGVMELEIEPQFFPEVPSLPPSSIPVPFIVVTPPTP